MLGALNKNSEGLKKVIGEVANAWLRAAESLESGEGFRRAGTTIFLNNYKEGKK